MWFTLCAVLFLLLWIVGRRQADRQRDAFADSDFSVHFLDVGQGDAIYIHSGDADVLIDAGEAEYGDTVVQYLNTCGVSELDLIIATHPHSDHIGGLAAVCDEFAVDQVLFSELPDDMIPTMRTYEELLYAIDRAGAEYVTVQPGQTFALGDAVLTILGPVSQAYDDLNDYSVVAQLSYGETDFLFTGDQTAEAEQDLTEAYSLRGIEVLKVGHHGSSTSSSKRFLDQVQPAYAVISCGANNSYNHPNESVLRRLLDDTDNIFRTDVQGTVVFTSDGSVLSVSFINN